MAKKSFRCKLVTPTAALVDEPLTYASVPLWDGLMGFQPGRAPILARLGLGELRLDFADTSMGEGGSRAYLIEGGFAKMAEDQLTILAERATPSENITLAEAEAELRAADATTIPAEGTVTAAARQAAIEKRTKDRQRAMVKVQLAKSRDGI